MDNETNITEFWGTPVSSFNMYTMEYADPDYNVGFGGSFTFILPWWCDIGIEVDKIIPYSKLNDHQKAFVNVILKKDNVDLEDELYHLNCNISFGVERVIDLLHTEIAGMFDSEGKMI